MILPTMVSRISALAVCIALLLGCGGRNLGDQTTTIRWKKNISAAEMAALWPADMSSKIHGFGPKYGKIDVYDYEGINIVITDARFATRDLAFGFHSLLAAEPRNTFESGIWYRPPYLSGLNSERVVFAFSPNQMSFFSPFVRDELARRLGKSSLDETMLSWHKQVLPKSNIYRDSEFYLPEIRVFDIPLLNIYGAKYQSKNSIAHLYIARYNNEGLAEETRASVIMKARRSQKKLTEYPSRLGSRDRGTWWKNPDGSVSAILAYRWLVLYFADYADEWHLDQVIQDCFTQMHRVRDRALTEP